MSPSYKIYSNFIHQHSTTNIWLLIIFMVRWKMCISIRIIISRMFYWLCINCWWGSLLNNWRRVFNFKKMIRKITKMMVNNKKIISITIRETTKNSTGDWSKNRTTPTFNWPKKYSTNSVTISADMPKIIYSRPIQNNSTNT